jgi:molybdopterin-binding protein
MVQECRSPQAVNLVDLRRSNQNPAKSKTNRVMSSSIRNRLPGTIAKIVSDKVVSEIVIRTAAGEVTSVITTGSVQRMNLKEGDQVFAIIKATEVSVEKE